MEEKVLRVSFIGHTFVGKTAIICRLLHDVFPVRYAPTQEDHHTYRSKNGTNMELIDTSGFEDQMGENARNMATVFSDVVVLVFSVRCRQSFHKAQQLLNEVVETRGSRPCPVLLLGNRASEIDHNDPEYPLLVSSREAFDLLESCSSVADRSSYLEVSALHSHNIASIEKRIFSLLDKVKEAEKAMKRRPSTIRRIISKAPHITMVGQHNTAKSNAENWAWSDAWDRSELQRPNAAFSLSFGVDQVGRSASFSSRLRSSMKDLSLADKTMRRFRSLQDLPRMRSEKDAGQNAVPIKEEAVPQARQPAQPSSLLIVTAL